MGKLDKLLEYISPDRTIQQIYNLANQALGSFSYDKAKTETWDEFRLCMAKFFKHVNENVLNLKKPLDIPLTEHWKYCIEPLCKIYGSNGDITAFHIASTGNEGGLYAVLKALAMRQAEQYTKNEIASKVYFYWQGLTTTEKLAAADEYLKKYKKIIPSELLETNGAVLKSSFVKLLNEHPFIIQKLQQTKH